MENIITCPNCMTTISDNLLIEAAAKGEGSGSQSITCNCGERITYWQITAQLRNQKKPAARIMKWFRNLSKH